MPIDNGTGHSVFKLKTKEKISVPRVIPIPMPELINKVVNNMGEKEGEGEGIKFANMFDEVSINDIVQDIEQGNLDDDDQNDDNSTATEDKHYEDAKEVEEEDEKACNLEE